MTDDLLEAMARAVCLSFYGTQWEATSEFRRGICYEMSDAALSALAITRATLAGLRDGSLVAVPSPANMTDEQVDAIAAMANCCDGIACDVYRVGIEARPNATEAGHE